MGFLRELLDRATSRLLVKAVPMSMAAVEAGTLAGLRALVETCPCCNHELSGHSYSLAAMAAFDPSRPRSAYDLLKAISRRDWSEAATYNEWEGGMDDALVFVIGCPAGCAAVLAVEDPYMLGAKDRIIQSEVLDAAETRKLVSALPDKWRLIP